MKNMKSIYIPILFSLCFWSCQEKSKEVKYTFENVPDRIWIGEDFWTFPLEDWRVLNERVEYTGAGQNAAVTLLPYQLSEKDNDFSISVSMGLLKKGANPGTAGIYFASKADNDDDIRAAIYFGKGIKAGVSTEGYAFLNEKTGELPSDFDLNRFRIVVGTQKNDGETVISLSVYSKDDEEVIVLSGKSETTHSGIIQLVNNFKTGISSDNADQFWFDDFSVSGNDLTYTPENKFGPVLWCMHTLSGNTLKLTAQLPPVGTKDNKQVEFYLKNEGKWEKEAVTEMDADARTARFRVNNRDMTKESDYKVVFSFINSQGVEDTREFEGKIRKEPMNRPLHMGALTCQYSSGFPYTPLVNNLTKKNPDILYFSGDQIYEWNGGYAVKRTPEDTAILSYLGKWYMFGWVFGDLMRDVPTVCTPDDHDVFQGNIWGAGGLFKPDSLVDTDDHAGFDQTRKMVNAVNRTQCSHLPDPYDPTPIDDGMSVWYTSMNYGRISFAIISDRIFKSGPDMIDIPWSGRLDHMKERPDDMSVIYAQGLEFLGTRQEEFLQD